MAIGLGCMRLSTDAARDATAGRAVIAAALDAGVALLDTADAYALDAGEAGHNERLIAEVVATRGAIEVVTKGGLVRPGGAWRADGRAHHLATAARASRARLGVAAIDLYLLHAVDPKTPLATSVRALARLRDDGVVRRIGLSNVGVLQLEAALAITAIDAVEVELSPYKLDAIRGGLVAACAARGIRILAHRPLGGPAGARRLAADPVVVGIAARLGASCAEVAMAWLVTLAPRIVPLPGATRIETARSAGRAQALVLDDDARAALAARFLALDPTHDADAGSGRRPDLGARSDASAIRTDVPRGDASAIRTATPEGDVAAIRTARDRRTTSAIRTADTEGDSSAIRTANAEPRSSAARTIVSDSRTATSELSDIRTDLPEVVLVMGMPASGKSTVAADLATRGYLRLNRDERGGTLLALARQLGRELAAGARRVVIDNTYASRAARAPVVEIARRHGATVRCVVLATSLEDAQANAVARILDRHGRLLMPGAGPDNELARAGEIDPRAQYRFRRELEPPREDEGFASIEPVAFVRRPAGPGRPALIVELDDLVWRGRPRAPEAIELRPGARDALAAWSPSHVLAGTTWQPGLAEVEPLAAALAAQLDAAIHVMRCAHPAGPPVCWCRKPLPGLALALAHAHGLDLARSIHLGKGPADRGFAARAGLRYVDITAGWPAP